MGTLKTFEEFLNENFRIDSKNEKLISKMVINGPNGRWELNSIDLNDEGDEYIIITGQYAKSTTDSDTIWIPKEQFEEFKKMINSIRKT